jgi:peptidoglycan/xylan/chitin deacetylase (PgdA/CDA1 family)
MSAGGSRYVRKVRVTRSLVCLFAAISTLTGLTMTGASAAPPIVVSLTFNGNTASQYRLAFQQALQPRGQHATFFTSSGTVGSGQGFMTWTQLSDLQAGGNEIGGLTSHFTNLVTAPAQTARDEVCGDRQALMGHGLNVSSFAYPYGAFNQAAKDIVLACGYGTARRAGGLTATGPVYAGRIPPTDYLAVPAFAPSTVTLASLQSLVNGAVPQGGWIPVVIQNVCSQALDPANYATCNNTGSHMEFGDLTAFLDWIAASGQSGGAPADTSLQTVRQLVNAVDTIAPVTTIACNGQPCTTDPYSGPVSVSLTATDLGSGAASIHYTTDGSDPALSSPTYTAPFSQDTSGTIRFRSWDVTGNAGAMGSQALVIVPAPDTVPPVTTITCNDVACASTAYTGPVSVALSATDGQGSGVAAIHYTRDGTAPDLNSPTYTAALNVQQNTTVRFFAVDNEGNQEAPQARDIQITPSPVRVTFSWDDGKYSMYHVAWLHALQPHGVVSTFNINSGDTGTGSSGDGLPGYMTWANLQELYAAGNEIAGHTVNHINLVTAPDDATRIHQVCDDRQALLLHGLKPTSFAYPEGAFNQNVKDIVASCGYSNARAGGGVTATGPVYAETVPPLDMYATRTWATPGGAEITLDALKAAVLAASSHGGGWLQLQGHVVCSQEFHPSDYDSCKGYYGEMELSTLNAFLDWMQNSGQPGGAPAGVTMETGRQVIGPAPSSDVTPPVTTMTCNGAPCATTTYGMSVTVALNATDAESGVERTLYTTDGSNPVTSGTVKRYTAPFTISSNTTVRFLSLDRAMNVESLKTQGVLIDRTAPVTTVACNGTACSTGWYRTTVTVTLTATDAGGSGLNSTRYTTDGSTPSLTSPLYTGAFQVAQTTTVRYASWDNVGNQETPKSQTIRIDGSAPNVAVTAPADGASVRRGVVSDVSASATDVGTGTGAPSGILRVEWFLDGSGTPLKTDTTSPYSSNWNPPKTLALGTHTLTARATDVAGNARTSAPITFTLTS